MWHMVGADIYVAAGVLLTCLDNYESTHGAVCNEVLLICGFSGGHPHIFRVSSTTLGGISCGSEVGFTVDWEQQSSGSRVCSTTSA